MIKRLHEKIKKFMHALVERVRTFKAKPPTVEGAKKFVIKTVKAIYTKIFDFVKGCLQHAETIIIVVLATIGLTALICEMPWVLTLTIPVWIVTEYILPVFSACVIWLLIDLATWRRKKRIRKAQRAERVRKAQVATA